MAADKGRDLLLKMEDSEGGGTYTTIANLTNVSVAINNSVVDITNKSSGGWAEKLEDAGTKNVDISVSGVYTETTQQDLLITNIQSNQNYGCQITYGASDSTITGDFMISNFNITGGFDDAQTFDASLTSTGTITFA